MSSVASHRSVRCQTVAIMLVETTIASWFLLTETGSNTTATDSRLCARAYQKQAAIKHADTSPACKGMGWVLIDAGVLHTIRTTVGACKMQIAVD